MREEENGLQSISYTSDYLLSRHKSLGILVRNGMKRVFSWLILQLRKQAQRGSRSGLGRQVCKNPCAF